MLKGLTLTELARKIEDNRAAKKDYVSDTRGMQLIMAGLDQRRQPTLELDEYGLFPLRPLAHDQVGARTGVPAKYYDRMLTEAPELLCDNVNHWFRANPEKRMLRTLAGDGRAFLSNRYQRIENEEIANVALPILADIPDVQIVSSEITERRMYIQAVAPRVNGEVKVGDEVQAGVIISNSEVGCGAVSISAMVWRLVCLNGMKTTDTFRSYHVGKAVDDSESLWADDTRAADDRTVLLKVRDMVRGAVDETRFRQRVASMAELTGPRITGNPATAVEVLAAKIGCTEEEQGGILRSLIEGADLSAWGVLNAVTAQAHNARSYDRAVEFQAAGGALLELSPRDWKEVLAAA